MFKIDFDKRVVKEIKILPKKELVKILYKINKVLIKNPFPQGKNPKKLKGSKRYRLRAGNYRVLYEIGKNVIRLFSIDDRKNAYRR